MVLKMRALRARIPDAEIQADISSCAQYCLLGAAALDFIRII